MLLWPWVYKVLFESKQGVFKSNAVNTLNCARRTLTFPAWVGVPCFLFALCLFPVPMLPVHPSTPFPDMLIPPYPWQYLLGWMGKVMGSWVRQITVLMQSASFLICDVEQVTSALWALLGLLVKWWCVPTSHHMRSTWCRVDTSLTLTSFPLHDQVLPPPLMLAPFTSREHELEESAV